MAENVRLEIVPKLERMTQVSERISICLRAKNICIDYTEKDGFREYCFVGISGELTKLRYDTVANEFEAVSVDELRRRQDAGLFAIVRDFVGLMKEVDGNYNSLALIPIREASMEIKGRYS